MIEKFYGIELHDIKYNLEVDPVVKILQMILNQIGYDCGKVDGQAGNKTMAAVTKVNLKAQIGSSICCSQTWEYILNKL